MENVDYVVNIIKNMDIKDKLRLAINMNQSDYLSIQYDRKEMYKYFDKELKEIDEEYRKCLYYSKYFTVNFTMAKLIEMKAEEQNQVALFLFNCINAELGKNE